MWRAKKLALGGQEWSAPQSQVPPRMMACPARGDWRQPKAYGPDAHWGSPPSSQPQTLQTAAGPYLVPRRAITVLPWPGTHSG